MTWWQELPRGAVPAPVEDTEADQLAVPRISFPVPARLHPAADELEERTLAWLRDFGIIHTDAEEAYLRRSTLGRTYAWMIPEGETERVLVATQFCIWATVQDDHYTEELGLEGKTTALASHLLACEAIAENPHAPPGGHRPIELAYRDLFARIEQIATPQQVLRIRKGMLHYSVGAAADAAYTAAGIVPSVTEYRRIRHLIAHLHHHFVLTEVAQGFEMPPNLLLDAQIRELTDLAIQIIGLTNDVLGCPRDVQRRHIANLPMVLAHHHGCSVQEGIDHTAAEVTRHTDNFVQLSTHLRHRGIRVIDQYIRGLEEQIAGHLAWLHETGRYEIGL
ncbi:terpene synthase family protein [Streptomyces sp. NPDC001205]